MAAKRERSLRDDGTGNCCHRGSAAVLEPPQGGSRESGERNRGTGPRRGRQGSREEAGEEKPRSVILHSLSMRSPVIQDPLEEIFISHASVSKGESDCYKLVIRTMDGDPIHFQKREHDVEANALIPVHKGVV